MKNQIGSSIKRTVSRVILAGLIVSSLPTATVAKPVAPTPKKTDYSLANWKMVKPSKEALDAATTDAKNLKNKLAKMKRNIKRIFLGPTIASTIIFAIIGAILVVINPVVSVGTVLFSPSVPIAIMVIPIAILGGEIGFILPKLIQNLITTGVTGPQILKAWNLGKTLKKVEKKYPGILTSEQIKNIEALNKVMKGPLTKGVILGIRSKKAKEKYVKLAFQEEPALLPLLKSRKKRHLLIGKRVTPNEKIARYFARSRNLRNLEFNVKLYQEKVKNAAKEKLSKSKLFRIKGILKFLKLRLVWNLQKITLFHTNYRGSKEMLAEVTKKYIETVDTIYADLGNQFAQAVTEHAKSIADKKERAEPAAA